MSDYSGLGYMERAGTLLGEFSARLVRRPSVTGDSRSGSVLTITPVARSSGFDSLQPLILVQSVLQFAASPHLFAFPRYWILLVHDLSPSVAPLHMLSPSRSPFTAMLYSRQFVHIEVQMIFSFIIFVVQALVPSQRPVNHDHASNRKGALEVVRDSTERFWEYLRRVCTAVELPVQFLPSLLVCCCIVHFTSCSF